MKKKITKDMSVGDILTKNPNAAAVLQKYGFHCIGCPMSQMETLEQGAVAHCIDLKKLLKDLNSEHG